jgi:hypothetical protein
MNNHLPLPGIDVSGYIVSGLGDYSCEVGRSVTERRYGGWGGYFWIYSSTSLYSFILSSLLP